MTTMLSQGILVLYKPRGMNSTLPVRKIRALLESQLHHEKKKKVKVGHGGTLDPLAEGVLIIGIGKSTQELGFFQTQVSKSYVVTAVFGYETDSQDQDYRKVLRQAPTHHLTSDLIEENLSLFRGDILQQTPIYSSRRVEGKRAYQLARKGSFDTSSLPEDVLKPRPKHVWELEMDWFHPHLPEEQSPSLIVEQKERMMEEKLKEEEMSEERNEKEREFQSKQLPLVGPEAQFRVKVGSGFYVRQFVSDLGRQVGSAAHCAKIIRSEQEPFHLSDCLMMDEHWDFLNDTETLNKHLQRNVEKLQEFKEKNL